MNYFFDGMSDFTKIKEIFASIVNKGKSEFCKDMEIVAKEEMVQKSQ